MKSRKKEIISMLLAGGQGSRLNMLTKKIAKPAVPFGGKYRIIDFTLSNCANSGIDTVGVLTQYKPLELNSHIGIGSSWGFDRNNGGITILAPYMGRSGGRWYKGTANAVFENKNFIEKYDPEYVLILSGDHVYKMDYSLLLEYHKEKGAGATIAVITVPWEEANRFGIMNVDNGNKIYKFDEKPENPKSNLASMGVYIFDWKLLKRYLIQDEQDENSVNDFGKNIIPKMLKDGVDLYAYQFNGYWKDVGDVKSLWEANMDLLKENNKLNIYDPNWYIYSNDPIGPPQYIGESGKIRSSILNDGCIIHGEINNSVLFPGVYVGKNSKITDCVIMPGAKIEDNVIINKAIVMKNVVVKSGNIIEDKISDEIVIISE